MSWCKQGADSGPYREQRHERPWQASQRGHPCALTRPSCINSSAPKRRPLRLPLAELRPTTLRLLSFHANPLPVQAPSTHIHTPTACTLLHSLPPRRCPHTPDHADLCPRPPLNHSSPSPHRLPIYLSALSARRSPYLALTCIPNTPCSLFFSFARLPPLQLAMGQSNGKPVVFTDQGSSAPPVLPAAAAANHHFPQ